ncbi:Regulator of chromosome condensation (RCC1) repeat protein [Pelotomaculum schinkii]|uniref:Regulator of chromosome condensation (RCC1) repeat protein n=1 Tax=Pelotomaculum schinkii TaxID=78350 RepID=A0A4Y7RGC1_9FIRM|nr:hemoblobin-interacting domain-containing protein [Pelotomaculum schinkii]TEB08065.1 Regulator of chromosome condensation (RCC1) repeat protein [Pelotomaculum schinkii]
MRIRSSWVFKLFLTVFSVLLLAGTVSLMAPADALAAGGDIIISGPGLNGPVPVTITQNQLRGTESVSEGVYLQQQDVIYSTINTWPTKSWYRGQGVKLTDLLDLAGGLKPEATQIRFTSGDNFRVTFTVEELLNAPRYRFPNFMSSGLPGHLPGDPSGKVLVDTIIAHRSFSAQSYNDILVADNFSRSDANHLLYGQRAVTQQTNARFAKLVVKIEVLTDPVPKWDNPTVNPAPGEVPAGTMVEMHSPFDDEDKVHYTLDGSDPTIDSPMYNWIAMRWWSSRSDDLDEINHKIGPLNSDTTIKAVVIGPGRSDSEIVTKEYLVPFGSAGAGDMVYVAGKDRHTVAIKNDGTVWAWGDGAQGKLGDGSTETKYTPVQVSSLTEVTAAAPGYNHTLALKDDGTVWAWGYNLYGQLGNGVSGTSGTRTVPEQVYGLTGVQAIAAGDGFSLALKNDGTVWAWGKNSYGQLGIGAGGSRTVAEQVYGLTDVQAIAAGKEHALALKNDGTVWAWGKNSEGQLGDGTQTNSNKPVQATGLTGVFKAIAAGSGFSLAIKEDGTVWGWGFASSGQLGNKDLDLTKIMRSLVPVQASDLTDVKAITAGDNHTMALQTDGSLWVWGNNSQGQLGNGKMGYDNGSKVPIKLYGPEAGIAMLNAGSNYSQALKTDGTAWAWGNNSKGKLGDGTTSERLVPTQVKRAPVTLTPAAGVIAPGEALDLTFADFAGWRESITSVIVGNKSLTEFDYTVGEGKITIAAGVLSAAGEFDITFKAAGYADSVVTMQVQGQPEAPPVLAADTTDNKAGNSIDLTFTDDAAWRAAITGITVNGSALTSDQYTVTEGNINITADVFTAAEDYEITVSATGYNDATVTQTIGAAEALAITITGDGVPAAVELTLSQVLALPEVSHSYSAINNYPAEDNGFVDVKGVKLQDILDLAQIKGEAKLITIKASDGLTKTFTRDELLAQPRYYFPGLMEGSSNGKVLVPAILSTDTLESNGLRLIMGQRAVTEQNKPWFVKKVNEIIVFTEQPLKWDNVTADVAEGVVAPGTEVTLGHTAFDGVKIYYTLDGSTPDVNSNMYNKSASYYQPELNVPIKITADTTIKAIAIGPGRADSDVVSFTYTVDTGGEPAAPVLKADTSDNTVGQAVDITFTDDADWRSAITEITVDGATLADGKYTVSAGVITIAADVFTEAKDYTVVVKAAGYEDAAVVQTIEETSGPNPVYTVTPEADDAYTAGTTQEGINTMTVNDGVTGFKYFTVNIAPVVSHSGNETVIFTHFRNGSQLGLNATRADFDQVEIAQAGFNVQSGDVIKAYIVDNLTNAIDLNPIILQ